MAKKFKFTGDADKWNGTDKADDVNAKGGDDKLNGKGGNDTINGAAGDDECREDQHARPPVAVRVSPQEQPAGQMRMSHHPSWHADGK